MRVVVSSQNTRDPSPWRSHCGSIVLSMVRIDGASVRAKRSLSITVSGALRTTSARHDPSLQVLTRGSSSPVIERRWQQHASANGPLPRLSCGLIMREPFARGSPQLIVTVISDHGHCIDEVSGVHSVCDVDHCTVGTRNRMTVLSQGSSR